MTKQEFISEVVNELLDNDFSVFFHQEANVEECGGWFSHGDRELTVALGNSMGFEILIHEFSHYLQWKNFKEWFVTHNGGSSIFFAWMKGVDCSSDIVDLAWRDAIAIELHCERQALWLIETLDLPVDVDKYRKAANAYLLFYQFVRSNRAWCKSSPYNNDKILDAMPNELQPLEYYLNPDSISEEVKEYFEECFIE